MTGLVHWHVVHKTGSASSYTHMFVAEARSVGNMAGIPSTVAKVDLVYIPEMQLPPAYTL